MIARTTRIARTATRAMPLNPWPVIRDPWFVIHDP